MKGAGYILVGVLATLCVLAPIAMAGGAESGSGLKSGGAAVAGADITPATVTATTGNFSVVNAQAVDAGVVQTSQLYMKSSPASGFTIDCRFNANQDSNALHLQGCAFRTASQVTFAGGSQLIQAVHSMHTGSAVSTVDSASTAPTVATACTGEAMTWAAGSASLRFDVGTSCTGVSTAVITLPSAATNCWTCDCPFVTGNKRVVQTACTTTTATMTNMGTSVATPADWADGDDVQCMCRGG